MNELTQEGFKMSDNNKKSNKGLYLIVGATLVTFCFMYYAVRFYPKMLIEVLFNGAAAFFLTFFLLAFVSGAWLCIKAAYEIFLIDWLAKQ